MMSAARSELDSIIDKSLPLIEVKPLIDQILDSEESINDLNDALAIVNLQHNSQMGSLKYIPSALSPISLILVMIVIEAVVHYLFRLISNAQQHVRKSNFLQLQPAKNDLDLINHYNSAKVEFNIFKYADLNATCGDLWPVKNMGDLCNNEIRKNLDLCINLISTATQTPGARTHHPDYTCKWLAAWTCSPIRYFCYSFPESPNSPDYTSASYMGLTLIVIVAYLLLALAFKISLGRNFLTDDKAHLISTPKLQEIINTNNIKTDPNTTNVWLLAQLQKQVDAKWLSHTSLSDALKNCEYINLMRTSRHHPHIHNLPTGNDVLDNYIVPYALDGEKPLQQLSKQGLFSRITHTLINDTVVDPSISCWTSFRNSLKN